MKPKKPIAVHNLADRTFTDFSLVSAENESSTSSLSITKPKVKSRPTNTSSDVAEVEIPTTLEGLGIEEQLPIAKLHVKEGTVQVLTRLFPVTVGDYAAKPLDWRTFVIAMEDSGFPATHAGGSAVVFIHEKGEGRIVFHRPHPVSKIDQTMLQGFGKRMRKWFGWERGSLSVRKKSEEGVKENDE